MNDLMNDLKNQASPQDESSPEPSAEIEMWWNDTTTNYPRQATVVELFLTQATLRPHALAVVYGEENRSYGELDRQSHRLAQRLRRLGVSLESRVAVFLLPGCDMVVALLAILRAGGVYVPLDPTYPRERLAFMLHDSSPVVVISQRSLVDDLPARGVEVVVLDHLPMEDQPRHLPSTEMLCPGQEASNLAYVIYTSGSTGRPKGVSIPHRAIVRLVVQTNYITLEPEDRVAQVANTSFDAATFEIWAPLLNGGCIVGLAPSIVLEPSLFALALRRGRIGSLFLTTALFNQTVGQCSDAFSSVEHLLVGGEAADPGWFRRALKQGAPGHLCNIYGPTENTTFSTFFPLDQIPAATVGIPIGGAIANSTAYLVDRTLHLVPVGSPGELLTGGDGLARGYHGRPRLTALCFVPNPFGGQAGSRLYHTGDLVQRRGDGAIEFQGRVDLQIKLRGFRVELGEIAAALGTHPRVAVGTVLFEEQANTAQGSGGRQLVAYVVPKDEVVRSESKVESRGGEEQVSQWQMIFEDLYGAEDGEAAPEDPTFDITGWISTYTEEPIPQEEMREWLSDTISNIASLNPRRVLEIGCGTGMLLFRIAPSTELYFGTDISQRALEGVEAELARRGDLQQVLLAQRSAEHFDDFEPDSFDTVLLNSVVQYFPSADYLATVLQRAAQVVRPGGSIFVGDVRNLPLLDAFHASVELFQAPNELPLGELRQRIEGRRQRENELVLDPAFFTALQELVPEISRVEIIPKRGRAQNELTAHRYQAVLHVGAAEPPLPRFSWLDWKSEGMSLAALRRRLKESSPRSLGFKNVPNLRVVREAAGLRLLAEARGLAAVGEVRQELLGVEEGAVEPQDLWDLEEDFPYDVAVGQMNDGEAHLTVVVQPSTEGSSRPRAGTAHRLFQPLPTYEPKSVGSAHPPGGVNSRWGLERYANNPARGAIDRPRVSDLRAFLSTKLPQYMVPSSFVFMDAMPLTPNGKIDRVALGRLAQDCSQDDVSAVDLPRTPMQDLVATLWAQVLGLDHVGIHDDFFALGGHSLKATQVVSRLRETLKLEITIRQVMEVSTVAELAEVVDGIERREEGRVAVPPLVPRPCGVEEAPASFAQRRLWFLHRWLPGNLAYNVPLLLHFRGPLSVSALDGALAAIAQRHEALRTTFREGEEGPVQVVAPPAREPLPWVDLSSLGAAARSTAERLCAMVGLRPYDLATGPLWRRMLVQIGHQEFLLLIGFHHIIFDGWSMGLLYGELAALYEAARSGKPSPLPAPVVQPVDVALWQHSWLKGELLEGEISWWWRRLGGAPTVLELPTDRPRRARRTMQSPGATFRFSLAPDVLAAMTEVGRRRGATLFMVILTAYQILMSRLSGQQDLLVGSPVANRTRKEVEDLIGFFVNTLPLRAKFAGVPTFATMLDQARQETLAAYAHQDVPFEMLVQALDPERTPGVAPLIQVMVVLQSAPMEVVQLPGLELETRLLPSGATRSDLGLEMTVGEAGLVGEMEYSTELFDATTVERLVASFTILLDAVGRNPEVPLARLSLLTAAQQHQLLAEWNDPAIASRGAQWSPVHELFAGQVAKRPEAVAVEQGAVQVSYGELRRRVSGLAAFLVDRGMESEMLVGLSIHRSPELVIAMLAVLQAGGAYLPLDTDSPEERRASLLRESRAAWLLTTDGSKTEGSDLPGDISWIDLRPSGTSTSPVRVVFGLAPSNSAELPQEIPPDRLAYVLYTSGSTGKPKGVMISHRALGNQLAWMIETFDFAPDDSYLQRNSIGFDPSVWEIFVPLVTGGHLLLVAAGGQADPAYLAKVAVERRIQYLDMVPSLLQLLLEEDGLENIPLKMLICGGEALPTDLADRMAQSALGRTDLVNCYGPTETCIQVTWARFPRGLHGDPWASLAIGRPILNTQAYVLDWGLHPSPLGVSGELMIGGCNLARGYLGSARQTAVAFLPNPFACMPGERLYRTGDIVQNLADGRLVFHRRKDFQIKLRGLRIEPAEIETVLLTHPKVQSVVVTSQEQRLVAWLVSADEETPAATELQEFLARSLPTAMVPTSYTWLETLPTKVSGKVDRAKLQRRALPSIEGHVSDDTPRTPTEEILQGIGIEVLQRKDVGRRQSFFDLGGHSLLAARWVSRIRTLLGVDIPLTALFEDPTIEALAKRVEAAQHAGTKLLTPPLLRRKDPLGKVLEEVLEKVPASFAQERLWFLHQWLPESPVYNVPVVLRLVGRLDLLALERSLAEIERRHEVLRTVFVAQEEGPPWQRILSGVPQKGGGFATLPRVDLAALSHPNEEAGRLLQWAARQPFDLEQGPLCWTFLVSSQETEYRLFVGFHHIAFDGASMEVFIHELTELYKAFGENLPSPLPDLQVRYTDFSVWQRGWLEGERLATEIEFWRDRLAGAPALLELPTDRPRPAVRGSRGDNLQVAWAASLMHGLERMARNRGVTLFMVLVAGFATLLSRLSGQRDIVLGMPIASRTHRELESLLGFFVNTLVLRLDLTGRPSFEQLLVQVRRVALAAYRHQDLPFEKLIEELRPDRNLSHAPFVQVVLGLELGSAGCDRLGEVSLTREFVKRSVSKGDLSLVLEKTEDGLRGEVEFSAELFDATTLQRWLGHLEGILGAAMADPECAVDSLPWLDPVQRGQLVVEWNDTARRRTGLAAVHELFARQAALRPHAVALEQGTFELSFGELRRQVVALAALLGARGLRPEALVGLSIHRSPQLVIAMLAVMEAGGAYIPLDPDHPEERRTSLLRESQAAWLLTAAGPQAEGLDSVDGLSHLDLLTEGSSVGSRAVESVGAVSPPAAIPPQRLAYVLYTSGSSGRPKGVMMSHGALSNFLQWMIEEFKFAPEDSYLAGTPAVFDPSVKELFLPLISGGRIMLVEAGGQADFSYLAKAAVERRTRHLQMVPSQASLYLEEPGLEGSSFRQFFCGGEALPTELADRLANSALGGIDLYNFYGPTETCVLVTWAKFPAGVNRDPWSSLAIGRPIGNTQAHVLDQKFRPTPLGVSGELMIAGESLGRGYLGAPRQTAEVFLPDPFASEPGARLYRTGDLVHSLQDGRLIFQQRKDFQIKLHGLRIEPAEIETVLLSHPAVLSAVVTSQEQRLVAWLISTGGESPSASTLRELLAQSLPVHMIPMHFLWLESFPTTSTGKVDRAALQGRALPTVEEESSSDAPQGATEEILQGLWVEVLKREQVGRRQSFFDLGGHSLLAIRVTSRASTLFGVVLGPRQLFEHPTVAALAAEVDRLRAGGQEKSRIVEPMRPVSRRDPLVLSFGQERLWFLDQLSPGDLTYNSTFPLGLEGRLDVGALHWTFEQLVDRHEILRTTFVRSGDQPVQRISPGGCHPLPVVDLRRLEEASRKAQVERLTFEEEQRPYDLARGPLFRTLVLRLADDYHALLLSCHHIVFDGWSLGILMDETIALYECRVGAHGRLEASEDGLRPLPVQYADYAAWQRRRLEGEALEEQLSWWRKALGSTTPSARLPTDTPRAEAGPSRARRQNFRISATTSEGLRNLARQENATLFMTLLATFKTLLHRVTGADSVVLGTPIANRHPLEVEGLIGFFVNTLVIRTDFEGRPDFRTVLARVRDAALGAYDHQDLPYERLVAELQASAQGSSAQGSSAQGSTEPLFQTLFTLGDLQLQPRQVPGLLFRPLAAAAQGRRGTAFELSLGMVDRAGEADDSLVGSLEYDGARFEAATINALLRRFTNLLDYLVSDPGRAVAELEILSPSEERQLHAASAEARHMEAEASRLAASDKEGEEAGQRSEEQLRAKVSARKEGLSDAKRALLARRLKRRKKGTASRIDTIPRRAGTGLSTGPAPLSFAQERLWFLDQLDPGSPTYNMTLPLRLRRALDLAALEDSFSELWRRHEGTRTRFIVEDGVPMQIADPPPLAPSIRRGLPLIDLSNLAESRREEEVDHLLEEECGHRFNLDRGPLVRVTLLRLTPGGDDHVLFFNIHHIISDGWSSGILTSELSTLYGAWAGTARSGGDNSEGSGRPVVLAEPVLQYSDFAHWQRQWLQGQELDRQLAYWRQQLAGELPVLDLPTDRPRPAVQTFRGASYRHSLGLENSAGLRQLGRQAETTLFVTLLSALTVLLGRLGGQDEVLVGTPIAGRGRSELEGLVGMFLNTLVLRADLRGEPSFRELLGRLHEVSLSAYAHQDLPFERLLEVLTPERDLSRTPLFQVFFNLINLGGIKSPTLDKASTEKNHERLDIEELSPEDLFDVASKFDLTLYVDDRPEITIDWVYNADLFDRAHIAEMAAQYGLLISAMLTEPQACIETTSLVTPSARLLLPDPTEALSGRFEGSISDIFETRAEEAPHRIAVVGSGHHLSYGTLLATSKDLAAHLRSCGVEAGQVIAVYGHRSTPLVEVLLAILRAGGAFLILDPAYPVQRQLACLGQLGPLLAGLVHFEAAGALPGELVAFLGAGSGLALTTAQGPTAQGPASDGSDSTSWAPPSALRFLSAQPGVISSATASGSAAPSGSALTGAATATPEGGLRVNVKEDSLAYVAFTSGSTGIPKGILGRHGSLTHFIPWQRRKFELGPEDRYSLVSGLSHDPLHREVFTPLQTGATVVLPASEDLELAGRAAQFMERERVTIAHLTPAMGQLLAIRNPDDPAPRLEALRWAFYVGDVLTHRDVDRLQGFAPKVKVVNYFGSTETQRAVAYHVVEEGVANTGVVPVGRGMPDVQLLLLTPQGGLAGVGEVAEICVRSPHLGLGYLADDDLTAQRFVEVPQHNETPQSSPKADRMVRSGDLGRYRLDGGVDVVGRADRQVKIRGVRIELGEIEAVLGGHPAVREAVVVRRQEKDHPGYLVAYITGPEDPLPSTVVAELREHLRQHLPEAMVPAFYVGLEALPLTPNRKVDRAALPAPDLGEAQVYLAPRTPVEEVLVDLWREVLGLQQPVSRQASFFELGGHSLLAAQLMARVRQAFQVEIPLRQLFESPTAQGLAVVVGQSRGGRIPAELTPITLDEERRYQPFPMTEVQEAYWIGRSGDFELGNVATHSYLELELPDLDLSRFEAAWQRLIERHDMLRAVMLPDGRQQVLETVPPYHIATLDLRGSSAGEAKEAMARTRAELSHQVLDPEIWPLFDLRASLLDGGRIRLHISRDLLIYDAWSASLLFEELMAVYRDGDLDLKPLKITFRDYVMAEVADRQGGPYDDAVQYWQNRLDTLPPRPELPLAVDPMKLKHPRFERRGGRLPVESWQAVRRLASRAGLTPSAVLLAAYAEVLSAFSKSPRFTLNLTLFNRQPRHPQVHQLVGDFTSLTLLEVAGLPGQSFQSRARQIQRQLWDDLDHREVGGVWVQRQLVRRRGGGSGVGMPVVFTSTLGLDKVAGISQDAAPMNDAGDAPPGPEEGQGKMVFNITQTPQVWLDHQVSEQDDRLSYSWDAVAELFPSGLLDSMFEAYEALLVGLALEETWEKKNQLFLTPAQLKERRQINATAAPQSAGMLQDLLLHQIQLRPKDIAVKTADRSLTYGELGILSAQLAHRLQELGARPNRLVAVVMEKGWEQVVAVLAVLRAGAAYQPIDATLPEKRRSHLLARGEVEIVLTESHRVADRAWPPGVEVLGVDPSRITVPIEGACDSSTPVTKAITTKATDLAYVMFTSGSTGEPKGVMIDHRGALNTVVDVNERFSIGPTDRVLALSALGFDLSVWDIFGVLGAGGTVVMPEPGTQRDPERWQELVITHGVTLWNTVPALVEMYVEYVSGRDGLLGPLRLVMMSGDWIPVTLPGRLRSLNDGAELPTAGLEVVSLGGATEASIWSILHPVDDVDKEAASIPYGRPMVNQSFHVLDGALVPRPLWVPGGLYIGGLGLAKGYWRDARKTALSFLPRPDAENPGERLYQTGDLGRYLASGEIEFLGREDFQVKVRGHRIELGEIEATLARHPLVREAVALALGQPTGVRHLAAFVVTGKEAGTSEVGTSEVVEDQLRHYLGQHLPAYMVPPLFFFLQEIPLTSNGKVDRSALARQVSTGAPTRERVKPANAMEEALVKIWSEVLAAEMVGVEDNFFELGGDSMRGIQIVNRAAGVGIEIRPMDLFEHQTIAALARVLSSLDRGADPCLVELQRGTLPPLYCVHAVGGNVFGYGRLAQALGKEWSVYGLRAFGLLDGEKPRRKVEEMAEAYLEEIRALQPEGPYRLLGWSSGGHVAFEMAARLEEAGESVDQVVLLDTPSAMPPREIDEREILLNLLETHGTDSRQELNRLSFENQLVLASEVLREAWGLPSEFNSEEARRVLRVYAANLEASQAFRPRSYGGRVLLVRAEVEGVSVGDFSGWRECIQGTLKEHRVPGHHEAMLAPENLGALVECLGKAFGDQS